MVLFVDKGYHYIYILFCIWNLHALDLYTRSNNNFAYLNFLSLATHSNSVGGNNFLGGGGE